MRKGKINYEQAMKQIDMMLPEEFKPAFREALERCKSAGIFICFTYYSQHILHKQFELTKHSFRFVAVEIKNHCDASYAIVQCFFENDTKFYFP